MWFSSHVTGTGGGGARPPYFFGKVGIAWYRHNINILYLLVQVSIKSSLKSFFLRILTERKYGSYGEKIKVCLPSQPPFCPFA